MATDADNKEQDFEQTPGGWAKYWTVEFKAAKKFVEKWHEQGERVIKRFLDERDNKTDSEEHWPFFWANITTVRSMLYGKTPKVTVTRRFADPSDDIARLSAELLERCLNSDIERSGDNYAAALQNALDDRLLPGFASARARYVTETENEEVEAKKDDEGNVLADGYSKEVKSYEEVETDYIHWKDELWSPARIYHDVRWRAWKNQMSHEQFNERFGDKLAKLAAANAPKASENSDEDDAQQRTPWARYDVWEIWDKDHEKVFWFMEGFPQTLDIQGDPLELKGFFPGPKPMFANVTTSKLIPRPDYVIVQDLYEKINNLSTRTRLLEEAIQVAGVYDGSVEGLQDLLKSSGQNKLIPVSSWALFAEKGGIKGAIDWVPLDQIVAALDKLREYRTELVGALYQLTGLSDIMRGQAQEIGVTATEQSLKAKFASVRMQALQDEFARFASDLQAIRAELISKFFDPETIIERSNAMMMFDSEDADGQAKLQQAIQLIKSDIYCYRIEVKPEAVSMTDFAQLKAERMEFLESVSGFLQAAAPLMQAVPGSMPFLLQMLQWSVAGVRGSSQIEGVLDKAIQQAEQAQQQQATNPQVQQPDPKLEATRLKAQADVQREMVKAQLQSQIIDKETQANFQRQKDQTFWNVTEQQARSRIKQAEQPGPPAAFDANNYGGGQ